jgi:hypothetical protein
MSPRLAGQELVKGGRSDVRFAVDANGESELYSQGVIRKVVRRPAPALASSPTDRRHNFVVSGRTECPKTRGLSVSGTLRMLSGTPFPIQDDTADSSLNRINSPPLPAGTYNALAAAGPCV